MKKCHLLLLVLLLLHLLAMAQNKNPKGCCDSDAFNWEWRKLGGKLNMLYDGERLRLVLEAKFPDTNRLAKKIIKEKDEGHWFSSGMGKMKIGDREVKISVSSDDITYEVHDHVIHFRVSARDIPFVVNGGEALNILLIDFSPDSAEFICTGKEALQKAAPEPESFTQRSVNWIAADTNRETRHCEYAVVLGSSDKGAFGFSRLQLREEDGMLNLIWDRVITHLVALISFWYLWYLLVAGRRWFNKIDPRLVKCTVQWLPWLTGFYVVFIVDNIVAGFQAYEVMKMLKTFKLPNFNPLKWRIGLTSAAVLLLIFALLWRKGVGEPFTLLVKAICRTLAYSMLAFVLIGASIQVADHYLGSNNPFSLPGFEMRLNVSASYAVWAIVTVYLYIAFVFYRLFAFNHIIQVIVIVATLCFAPLESYRIMGPGHQEKKCENCVSFGYDIKDVGETNAGVLDLYGAFSNQADMFYIIPLLITIYLIVKLSRRKDHQKAMVLMASLFFVFYCCYLTNIKETFLLFPVTLVTAIVLNRLIIVRGRRARWQLIQTGNQLYNQELHDIQVFKKMPELRKSVKLKEIYRQRMLDGAILPADYEKAVADLDKLVGEPGAENIQRRMEFGPYREPLRNGLSAMLYGILVSGLIYLVYFKFYLIETNYELAGIPNVLDGETTTLIVQHLFPVVLHGIAAFCLGYFFPFLKGNSGWEKGAWLGTAIGLAHLPIIYFTVENAGWAPLAGIFFKHVIILMITGFLACDLATIRKIYGHHHSWKEIVYVMGWKKALTLGAFVTTAIGSGITSWISDNVQEALKLLLSN